MRETADTAEPDALLLGRVTRGEAEAIETFVRVEHPRVYRLCLGFLADVSEAEDVAQDALIQLLDKLGRRDRRGPYAPWRNAVVANLCRDRRRRVATRRRYEDGSPPPPPLPGPEAEVAQDELRVLLVDALQSLTDREREVFVLRDLEGCSTAEAAGALAIAEGTVRSTLVLARRRLRTKLTGHLSSEPTGGEPS